MTAAATSFKSRPTRRGRILLVDDDPAVRAALSRALESEDYAVAAAGDGSQALEALDSGKLDIVLLDLNLPRINGWDIFERITSVEPFLPIIIITARPHQYELAAAAGATAIMEKPLCLPLLMETIERLLHEPMEQRVQRILTHRPLLLADPAEQSV
jgi:two-component system response regulator MprA